MRRLVLTGAAWFLASVSIRAAETLTVDLSSLKPGGSNTISIAPGKYVVRFVSLIPGQPYTLSALVYTKSIPPFPLDPFAAPPGGTGFGQLAATPTPSPTPITPCNNAKALADRLVGAKSEAEVPELRDKLIETLAEVPPGSCDSIRDKAEAVVQGTERTLVQEFSVGVGQYIEATATRGQRTWKMTFDSPEDAHWMTSYGFNFLPSQNDVYFSKPKTDETGKFVVTKEASPGGYDFAPSVFFTWIPGDFSKKGLDVGPTFGLGFDFSAPIVFVGGSVAYHQNVAITGGAVVHQRLRLNGQYQPGQTIGELLTSDQLSQKTYGVGAFFGVSFRFASRPIGFGKPAVISGTLTPTPTLTPASTATATATATPTLTATRTRTATRTSSPIPTLTPTPTLTLTPAAALKK